MWLVIERTKWVHVVPAYEHHELHEACWCVPTILEPVDDALGMLTHHDAAEQAGLAPDLWRPAA